MNGIEVDGVTYTPDMIRKAVAFDAALTKAAQDYLTYTSNVHGIPPAMGKFDPRECVDGGKCIEAYWRLFDVLHPSK